MAEKSSPKCRSSLDKDPLRNPEAKSTGKEDHQKSNNEMNELDLNIIGSISSDEEQFSLEQPSSRNSEAATNTTGSGAHLDRSISSDEEGVKIYSATKFNYLK